MGRSKMRLQAGQEGMIATDTAQENQELAGDEGASIAVKGQAQHRLEVMKEARGT